MAYTDKDKDILLNILYQNDFDIKNAVIIFNKETQQKLDRGTVYDWIKGNARFRERYSYFKKDLIKEAESNHRAIRNGIPKLDKEGKTIGWIEKPDRAANEFFLKTIGKDEGYVEKIELDNKHSGSIAVGAIDLTAEEIEKEKARILKNMLNDKGTSHTSTS